MKTLNTRILTPELLLKTRGNKEAIDTISKFLDLCTIMEDDPEKRLATKLPEDMLPEDSFLYKKLYSILLHDVAFGKWLTCCKRWLKESKNVFYFAKPFADALTSIKLNITHNFLPEEFSGYFAFPDNYFFDGETNYSNAFVYITRIKRKDISTRRVIVAWDTGGLGIFFYKVFELDDGKTIEQCVVDEVITKQLVTHKDVNGQPYKKEYEDINTVFDYKINTEASRKMLCTVLNALAYVHSLEPNMENLKPFSNLSTAEKSNLRKNADSIKNMCSVPVTLVNWNYKKDIVHNFNVDSTIVNTHLRWQRCGIALSQVKLIWVKEHERVYKNSAALCEAQQIQRQAVEKGLEDFVG